MFDFSKVVLEDYKITVVEAKLKDIYNSGNCKRGRSTNETKRCGVYALFLNNELKKIGRAITGNGIFTRMSQYYRQDCGIKQITDQNKDEILVRYFTLNSRKDCWAAEKYLQAKAYYAGEKMPWDEEISEI